jgi:hypothetical protein
MTLIDLDEACRAVCRGCREGTPVHLTAKNTAYHVGPPFRYPAYCLAAPTLRKLKRWERISPDATGTESAFIVAPVEAKGEGT